MPELERVVIVLGAYADRLLERVEFLRAEPVVCGQWREGQAASLRCGVEALDGADKIVVTLGDQPLMTPELIARFAREQPGTRAVYGGAPGHPVVLGREHVRAVLALTATVARASSAAARNRMRRRRRERPGSRRRHTPRPGGDPK